MDTEYTQQKTLGETKVTEVGFRICSKKSSLSAVLRRIHQWETTERGIKGKIYTPKTLRGILFNCFSLLVSFLKWILVR